MTSIVASHAFQPTPAPRRPVLPVGHTAALERRVRLLFSDTPRLALSVVPWHGPGRAGDPVHFNAINGAHNAAHGYGDRLPGVVLVGHLSGHRAKVLHVE